MSYAVITPGAATLFVDQLKFAPGVAEHLAAANVTVESYDQFLPLLQRFAADWAGACRGVRANEVLNIRP